MNKFELEYESQLAFDLIIAIMMFIICIPYIALLYVVIVK